MKIVISYNPNDDMICGIMAALKRVDDSLIIWDMRTKPVYDMIDEIQPDLLLLDSQQITPTILRALEENKNISVVLFGLSYYQQVKPLMMCLPYNTPQILFKRLDEEKILYYLINPAANIAQYTGGEYDDRYQSDILYLSVDNKPHMTILTNLSIQKYKFKICGRVPINLNNYLGQTTFKDMTSLIKSTKIGIDFNCSMLYNYIANGILCLSDTKNDYYPHFTSFGYLVELIEKYLYDEDKRQDMIQTAQKEVLRQHTYFNRLKDILFKLQIYPLANECDKVMETFQL